MTSILRHMKHINRTVDIIIPAYNEADNLKKLASEIHEHLRHYINYRVIFIDDGSTDNTCEVLNAICSDDECVDSISFTRNFGHQSALLAGIRYCHADCAISMDADFQHPVSMLKEMIEKWVQGYEIVYTIRKEDPHASYLKRQTAGLFYCLLNFLSDESQIEKNTPDFRLLDKKVVNVIKEMNENTLFIRGLIHWFGYKSIGLEFVAGNRKNGKSRYSLKKMMQLAFSGITSTSLKPLYFSLYIGFFLSVVSLFYACYAVFLKLFTDYAIQGWTSVLITVICFGSLQLFVLGIIGIYISKIYLETKARPVYLIKEKTMPDI